MKYVLFIDGMNLAWKAMHSYDLTTSSGVNTSAIYGFMAQLSSFIDGKNLPVVVVWDGGYPERSKISKEGVKKGIIKASYKSNRGGYPEDSKEATMNDQLKVIVQFLRTTDVKQIFMNGHEADDIIASYAKRLSGKVKMLCLTCDHDYYQLIDDGFDIVSRWKGEETIHNWNWFIDKYGIEPWQWVEVGALSGDSSDCIIGVPGCGDTTAIKYIKEHGSAEDLIIAMENKFSAIRAECPDLQSWEDVNSLIEIGMGKGNTSSFDGCYPGMPFSGVALALARKEVKKIKQIELKFAMYQERIRLAHKLKKMDRDIDVPNVKFNSSFDEQKYLGFCDKYELNTLALKSDAFDIL